MEQDAFIDKYLKGEQLPDHYAYVLRLLKGPGRITAETCRKSKLFSVYCTKRKYALKADIGAVVVPEKLNDDEQKLGIYIKHSGTMHDLKYHYILFDDLIKNNFKVEDAHLQESSKIYKILRIDRANNQNDQNDETDFVSNLLNDNTPVEGSKEDAHLNQRITRSASKISNVNEDSNKDSDKEEDSDNNFAMTPASKDFRLSDNPPESVKKKQGSAKKQSSAKKQESTKKESTHNESQDESENSEDNFQSKSLDDPKSVEKARSISATPKSRGRPPKKSLDGSEMDPKSAEKAKSTSATHKRPRGRPPKKSLDVSEMDPKSAEKAKSTSATPKRPRGRPPKKSLDVSGKDLTPKKRGRPPKASIESKKNDLELEDKPIENSEDNYQSKSMDDPKSAEKAKSTSATPKRPRGRPRKVIRGEQIDLLKSTEKDITPKKRGRPPKITIETVTLETDDVIPKKRGRPPKASKQRGRPPKDKAVVLSTDGKVAKKRGRPPKNKEVLPVQTIDKYMTSEWKVPEYTGRGRKPVCKSVMICDEDLTDHDANDKSDKSQSGSPAATPMAKRRGSSKKSKDFAENDDNSDTESNNTDEKLVTHNEKHVSFGPTSSFRRGQSHAETHVSKKVRISKFDKYDSRKLIFADFKTNGDGDTIITKYEGKIKYNGQSETCDILFEDNLHDNFQNVILSEIDEYIRISDFYKNYGMIKANIGSVICDEYYSFYSKDVSLVLTDKFGSFPVVFPYEKANFDSIKKKTIKFGNTLSLREDNIDDCLQIMSAELIAFHSEYYYIKYQYLTFNELLPEIQQIEMCISKIHTTDFIKICESKYMTQSKKEYEESDLQKLIINEETYEVKDNWKDLLERFVSLE